MKITTLIGIGALTGAVVIGCSSSSVSPAFSGEATGDDGGSSGASSSGASSSGQAGSSSGGTSSGGTSSGGTSSGGASSGGASSGGTSSGALSDAGGLQSGDAAPGSDPETDYTQSKTLVMDSFTVPVGGEVFKCQDFASPWGTQVDIKTYSLDMSTGSHHMFAFYKSGATNGAVADCPGGGLTFGAFTFSAQSPTLTQTYPTTVGATVPQANGFTLMVHYLNTGNTPLSTHVALKMDIAKKGAVTQHAGVIFLNNAGIRVPPGMSNQTSTFTLPQNVTILSTDSHMHQQATNFVATAGSTPLFTTTQWAEPPAKVFSPVLTLSAGTTITWTCTYNNTTGTTMTFGESAKTNVMCISTSIFYPVSDVNNPVLGSPISGLLGGFGGH